jgi:hypothetical protein
MTCWVVTDGKAGMVNQCLGLADALGLTPVVKQVRLRFPWKQLSPSVLRLGNRWSLAADGDQLDGPLPDILIATGRHSVSSSLAVREMSGGRAVRIQIQDPGIPARHFDLVIVPRHDRLRGDNVVVTRGALHRINAATLAAARDSFPHLALLPRPRVAVLIGGSNGAYRLTAEATAGLADRLVSLAKAHQASLMVTPSRRTGADNEAILRERLASVPGELWDGSGDNPYGAYLAYADAVVVTCDSVNMVCEACFGGQPVYVAALPGGSAKFQRFHQDMEKDGFTRPFEGTLADWRGPGLDDTSQAAAAVRRLLNGR